MTASVTIPGSKSLTNRALMMAALANGKSVLKNALQSDDTRVMIRALRHMGVEIKRQGTTLTVTSSGKLKSPKKTLFLGNAGTAVRFLTAVVACQPFSATLDGNARMRERPLNDLINALKLLNADMDCPTGCPPVHFKKGIPTGDETHLSGRQSSQYVSSLLMAAPLLPRGLTIRLEDALTSKPYVDLTLELMEKFGIKGIRNRSYRSFRVPHGTYHPQTLTIEADASAATYFLGMAALTGRTLTIENLTRATRQPDIKVADALEAMGCTLTKGPNRLTITGPKQLKGLGTLDANDFPDGAMTLAVVAAFAKGTTTLTGLHNLKYKESDRLNALAAELAKINAKTQITGDSITIRGNRAALHGARIETYDDHRIAMCFGMAGTVLKGMKIKNPNCVAKTYPHFWEDLRSLKKLKSL